MRENNYKRAYGRQVVLVFNRPNGSNLKPNEQAIFDGLSARWAANRSDPNCERLSIIFVEYNEDTDYFESDLFEPLRHLTNKDRLYIVGHCSPGSDNIASDSDAYLNGAQLFSYQHIAALLAENLKAPSIKGSSSSTKRRLRIVVSSCYSGLESTNSASFSEKLARELVSYNHNLHCDVVGTKSLLVPIGTSPDFYNAIKFLANSLFTHCFGTDSPIFDVRKDFHKRYLNYSSPFFQSHANEDDKIIFRPVYDLESREVLIKRLSKNDDHRQMHSVHYFQDISEKVDNLGTTLYDHSDAESIVFLCGEIWSGIEDDRPTREIEENIVALKSLLRDNIDLLNEEQKEAWSEDLAIPMSLT